MNANAIRSILLAGTAVVTLASVPVLAQTSATTTSTTGSTAGASGTATTTTSSTPSATVTTSPGATTSVTGATAGTATQSQVLGFNADRLVGKNIYGSGGEEIGEIDSLAISAGATKQVYALVDVGGFLGIIGGKTIAIPVQDLEVRNDDGFVLKSMTKQQANDMPGVNTDQYQTVTDRSRPLRDLVATR